MKVRVAIGVLVSASLPCLAQQAERPSVATDTPPTTQVATRVIEPQDAVAVPTANPKKVTDAATAAVDAAAAAVPTPTPAATLPSQIDLNTATIMQMKCWSPFAIRVPEPTVRMIPQMDADAYVFQFVDQSNKILMTIYSGHNPHVGEKGKACSTVIAGQRVNGWFYKHPSGTQGQEYVMLVGKDGAALHIIVEMTPYTNLMYQMLEHMSLSESKPVNSKSKAYAAYVYKDINSLNAECVRIFRTVINRATADAAAPQVRAILNVLQKKHEAMDVLITRSGRSLLPYLQTVEEELSPEDEAVIRKLHEVDCYGSSALQEVLLEFLGM